MFKRVISNPEEVGGESKKQHNLNNDNDNDNMMTTQNKNQNPNDDEMPTSTTIITKRDENTTDASVIPPEVKDNSQQQAATTTTVLIQASEPVMRRAEALLLSSSATPVHDDDDEHHNAQETSSIKTVNTNTSNPSGSGNWGWFEDVHGGGGDSKNKSGASTASLKHHAAGGGGGMVPTLAASADLNDIAAVSSKQRQQPEDDAAAMAVTAPTYVLEESLSSQKLWKDTAGTRPPQPVEERAFYEKMWAQNFQRSRVDYGIPPDVLTRASPMYMSPWYADGNNNNGGGNAAATASAAAGDAEGGAGVTTVSSQYSNYYYYGNSNYYNGESQATDAEIAHAIGRLYDNAKHSSHHMTTATQQQPVVVNKTVKSSNSDGDLTVLIRGDNVFGTTVSKSFPKTTQSGALLEQGGVDTVNISIASYRVVESKTRGKYAQFLVIYREGSIRDTIGVWKRYSDFDELSRKVTTAHGEGCSSAIAKMSPLHVTEEADIEHLPNAITSWRLLKKRQRWYRCLDAGYLSLKVFLLERFLHDILFESSSPKLLRDFVRAGHGRGENASP